jgi:hypothetical protein
MALLKSLPNRKGINATYWKIAQLNINYLQKQSHIDLVGFSTKELRKLGKDPIDQRSFDFNEDEFPFNDDPVRQIAYEAIKKYQPKTNDGEDLPAEFQDARGDE